MINGNELSRSVYYSTHFRNFQNKEISNADIQYYKNLYENYLPKDKSSRILEIGCGLGKFLYFLKQLDYNNIEGIDVSEELVEIAKKNSGIIVHHIVDINNFLNTKEGYYDLIVMFDVIEHIEKNKVIDTLLRVNKSLTNNGIFLISTENMASPIGRLQHYLDFTHEYNYTEITLQQVLEISGFKNIFIWGMKELIPKDPKGIIIYFLRKIWFIFIKFLNKLERPGCTNPKILTKEIYAIAKKN